MSGLPCVRKGLNVVVVVDGETSNQVVSQEREIKKRSMRETRMEQETKAELVYGGTQERWPLAGCDGSAW